MPFDLLKFPFHFSRRASASGERETWLQKNRGSHGFNGVTIGNSVKAVSVSAEKLMTHLYCFCSDISQDTRESKTSQPLTLV